MRVLPYKVEPTNCVKSNKGGILVGIEEDCVKRGFENEEGLTSNNIDDGLYFFPNVQIV